MSLISGVSPIGGIFGLSPCDVPDTTQRYPLGLKVQFHDEYYGARTAIYLLNQAAVTYVGMHGWWDVNKQFTVADDATQILLPYPCAFALTYMAASTYGWFVVEGVTPALADEEVDVGDPVYCSTSANHGWCADTALAQAQIERVMCVQAGAATIAKVGSFKKGEYTGWFDDVEGLFIGMLVASTSLSAAGSDVITAIGVDGHTVTYAGANATTGTKEAVTCTFTDATKYWPLLVINAPHYQGAVT